MGKDAALLVVGIVLGGLLGFATAPRPVDGAVAQARATVGTADPPMAAPPAPASCTPAPLEQRAAQVLILGLSGVREATDPLAAELIDLGVGGLILHGSNAEDAAQVRRLVDGLRSGAPVRPLIATDEEQGRVSSFRRVLGRLPSARRLAAGSTPDEVRAAGRTLGELLAELGVDMNLAPVADLDEGPATGIIGDRSFSSDPQRAAAYSIAFAEGLRDAGVVPVVKHFPGHGQSVVDSHKQLPTVTAGLDQLRSRDLVPFQAAIDAGLPAVMLNHVAYDALDPGLPASLSPAAYALLRDMGFAGVAMTDALGMGAVNTTWPLPEAAVHALAAGADALLANQGAQGRAMRDGLVDAVRNGRLDEARLDEAVARVLALKGIDPQTMVCHPSGTDSPSGEQGAGLSENQHRN